MLQRLQTLYFIISIVLFGFLFSGVNFLKFIGPGGREVDTIDLFGRTSYYTSHGKEIIVSSEMIPLVVLNLGMILLLSMCIFSFKKIHRQLNISRFTFLVNALLVILFVIWSTYLFIDSPEGKSNSVQWGFYLLCCTLPFTYFGYKGVLRDKLLLDSIDRIR